MKFSLILENFAKFLEKKYNIRTILKASLPNGSLNYSYILIDFVDFVQSQHQNKTRISIIRVSIQIVKAENFGTRHLDEIMDIIYEINSTLFSNEGFDIKYDIFARIVNIKKTKDDIYNVDIELNKDFEYFKKL